MSTQSAADAIQQYQKEALVDPSALKAALALVAHTFTRFSVDMGRNPVEVLESYAKLLQENEDELRRIAKSMLQRLESRTDANPQAQANALPSVYVVTGKGMTDGAGPEIDDNASISGGGEDASGVYVQSWHWVDNDDVLRFILDRFGPSSLIGADSVSDVEALVRTMPESAQSELATSLDHLDPNSLFADIRRECVDSSEELLAALVEALVDRTGAAGRGQGFQSLYEQLEPIRQARWAKRTHQRMGMRG